MAASVEYIWLVPMTTRLAALKTKKGSPLRDVFRSYRLSCEAFALTDSIPAWALAFAVYISLVRMISPLPALRWKWYWPAFDLVSSNFALIICPPQVGRALSGYKVVTAGEGSTT